MVFSPFSGLRATVAKPGKFSHPALWLVRVEPNMAGYSDKFTLKLQFFLLGEPIVSIIHASFLVTLILPLNIYEPNAINFVLERKYPSVSNVNTSVYSSLRTKKFNYWAYRIQFLPVPPKLVSFM